MSPTLLLQVVLYPFETVFSIFRSILSTSATTASDRSVRRCFLAVQNRRAFFRSTTSIVTSAASSTPPHTSREHRQGHGIVLALAHRHGLPAHLLPIVAHVQPVQHPRRLQRQAVRRLDAHRHLELHATRSQRRRLLQLQQWRQRRRARQRRRRQRYGRHTHTVRLVSPHQTVRHLADGCQRTARVHSHQLVVHARRQRERRLRLRHYASHGPHTPTAMVVYAPRGLIALHHALLHHNATQARCTSLHHPLALAHPRLALHAEVHAFHQHSRTRQDEPRFLQRAVAIVVICDSPFAHTHT